MGKQAGTSRPKEVSLPTTRPFILQGLKVPWLGALILGVDPAIQELTRDNSIK